MRRDSELIGRFHFHRRNALFESIRVRGLELETAHPDLGQIFVRPFGSQCDITKSKHPSGRYIVVFDEENHVINLASEYQRGGGSASSFEMRAAPEEQETVELWRDNRPFTDADIVKMIFDEFIGQVA